MNRAWKVIICLAGMLSASVDRMLLASDGPSSTNTRADSLCTVLSAPVDISLAHKLIGDQAPRGLEGVWMITNDETSIIIVRRSPMKYDILAGRTLNLAILPGTVLGTITVGGNNGLYDATLASSFDANGHPTKHAKLSIKVAPGGNQLSFTPYRHGVQINLRRLVPYLFRIGISTTDTRPDGLYGARRVWPTPALTFDNPIVL